MSEWAVPAASAVALAACYVCNKQSAASSLTCSCGAVSITFREAAPRMHIECCCCDCRQKVQWCVAEGCPIAYDKRSQTWRARGVKIGPKRTSLGSFETEAEAAEAVRRDRES